VASQDSPHTPSRSGEAGLGGNVAIAGHLAGLEPLHGGHNPVGEVRWHTASG
jgi:hypothetical protein